MSVDLLKQTLADLGVEASPELLEKFHVYFSLLASWNEKMNLTSIVEEEEVYEKHFVDSLLAAKAVSFSGKTLLDIGSGGGFPGLVIALVYPGAKVTVLDSTAKKFLFLREVCEQLGLKNVSFVNARIEDRKVARESFDIVISRGFAALPVFLECAAPFTKIGGQVVAMKGASYKEEMEMVGSPAKFGLGLANVVSIDLPNAGKRVNLVYGKTKPTPKKYPRRWDEMKRECR